MSTDIHRRPARAIIAALLAAALVFAAGAADSQAAEGTPPGQIRPENPKPVAAGEKSLIALAYGKTQAAKTTKDYTEIINMCRLAREGPLTPKQTEYAKRLMSWAHNRRGEASSKEAGPMIAAGRLTDARKLEDQAMADYQKAVELDPTRWQAVHNRGVSYAQQGDRDKALADFNRTIQLEPNFPNAWFNRGGISFERGDFKSAAADFGRVIRLKRDDAEAYASRGRAYCRLSRHAEALADFNQAIRLDPKDPAGYVDRADLFLDVGRWEEAAGDYREAVRLDQQFGLAYLGVAWIMATCPDPRFRNAETAIKSAAKAIELDGTRDPRYLATLAAAQANAGRFDEAKATIQKAIEIAPKEAVEPLKKQLALYEQGKPYRMKTRD